MAKILYSVMGEGFGHAIRSKVIIQHLSKKHDIGVFASGKAFEYLKDIKAEKIESLHLEYRTNRVLYFKTLLANVKKRREVFRSYNKISKKIKSFKPELFICDFEPLGNYAAFFNGVPCLSIDNQHFIMHGRFPKHKRHFLSFIMTCIMAHLLIIKAKYKIIFSLLPQKQKKRIFFYKPILRDIVRKFKPCGGDYFFVYQTTDSNARLIGELKKINNNFVVYGYNKTGKERNITFKKFSEKEMLKDLSGSRAAILGGGFATISEALYYNKPVLCTPIKNQFEQTVNALIIEKERWGSYSEEISAEKIENFIKELPKYKKISDHDDREEVLNKIDEIIAEF